jgi:hypothetical protein
VVIKREQFGDFSRLGLRNQPGGASVVAVDAARRGALSEGTTLR